MDIGVCNSYLLVNLDVIADNIRRIREHIGSGTDIMPILKGNAYGMGLNAVAKFLTEECGIKIIGNAQTTEALQLREAGITCELAVIGGVPFNNIPAVIEHDLITPAYHEEYLRLLDAEAGRQKKTGRVNIKVETGLNRIGVLPGEDLESLMNLITGLKNLEVVGAYTHFAEAEIPEKKFTLNQFALFKRALKQIKERFKLEYVHAFNTAATVWLKDAEITHVRPAGLIFGFDVNEEPKNILGLTEALTWRAFVTNVKTVPAGEPVGYNRAFISETPTRVATVSAGYGDGYARHLAAFCGAEMLVQGKRAKVIGTCMDQTFLNVNGIENVNINDAVTLIGRDGGEFISVFELQEKMGQTYLAVMAAIAQRVKKIYIKGE